MSSEWLAHSSRMRAACSLRRIICLPTGEICQVMATQSRTAWSTGRRHRTGLVRPPRPSPSSTPIRLPFRLESFQGSRVDTRAQEPHCMRNQKFFLRRTGPSESGPPAELRPCPGDRGAPGPGVPFGSPSNSHAHDPGRRCRPRALPCFPPGGARPGHTARARAVRPRPAWVPLHTGPARKRESMSTAVDVEHRSPLPDRARRWWG